MVTIPEEYEQIPSMKIDRIDGSVMYFFNHRTDPFRSLSVLHDEVMDWTSHFQAHMDSGNYPKK
jgi:hypothetical protein